MTDRNQPSPLADAASPFLRHGAEQPVAWLPWGDAAFRRAREEDRPILMDIGAVWCHWCHVMDRESYEDPDIAALINELYIPVKVDRDESPAVDARYQRAVQAISGQGGWPLTAFLTPDGEVFHGGTYFPPEDAHGRPSFRRVLTEIARVWREERGRAEQAAGAVRDRLTESLQAEAAPGDLDPALIDGALDDLADAFDIRHGGFGRAPKFPNPGGIELVLEAWAADRGATGSQRVDVAGPGTTGAAGAGSDWRRRVVEESLLAMARGGLHDQLGGGFHRYATDARWLVPHFEKMAYDNGPLLSVYSRAAVALEDEELRDAAVGIVRWYADITSELVAAGGFPASQDADIGFEDDGDYWTWTEGEIRQALEGDDDAAEAAILHWGLRDPGSGMHLDPERHVLFRDLDMEELAARLDRDVEETRDLVDRARTRLEQVRDSRPRPYVDETLYAGWVALVAAGHVAAARHLEIAGAGEAAERAMDRVWAEGWDDATGIVHRLADPDSGHHLADQAHCADAMLDLHEWTGDGRWLDRARSVIAVMLRRFRHESGALQDVPVDAEHRVEILARPRLEIADAPEPSANAVAARACARLAVLDNDDDTRDAARRILRAFAGTAPRFAASAATYFRALRWVTRPVTTVVVVEEEETGGSAAGDTLRAVALRTYRPNTVVRTFSPGAVDAETLPEAVGAMLTGEAPRAYVCAGQTCAAPVSDPAALEALLREF